MDGVVGQPGRKNVADITIEYRAMVEKVVAEITRQFDGVMAENSKEQSKKSSSSCSCGGSPLQDWQ